MNEQTGFIAHFDALIEADVAPKRIGADHRARFLQRHLGNCRIIHLSTVGIQKRVAAIAEMEKI